jgi:hypothetical protein
MPVDIKETCQGPKMPICCRAMRTHGESGYVSGTPRNRTKEYNAFRAMRERCLSKSIKCYARYGGRGIKICERWNKFENFLSDMGRSPEGTSLDRIDNNGNYCPENCRWATHIQQANNTSANRILEFNGKRQSVSMWERELGFKPHVIYVRLKNGWSVEDAITRKKHSPPLYRRKRVYTKKT